MEVDESESVEAVDEVEELREAGGRVYGSLDLDITGGGRAVEEDEEDDARDWRRNSLCCRSCCCRSCWRWMNSATASTWFSVGSLMASVRSKIANESSRMPQYANGDRGRLNGWRMS